jgi:hypothetical protein
MIMSTPDKAYTVDLYIAQRTAQGATPAQIQAEIDALRHQVINPGRAATIPGSPPDATWRIV